MLTPIQFLGLRSWLYRSPIYISIYISIPATGVPSTRASPRRGIIFTIIIEEEVCVQDQLKWWWGCAAPYPEADYDDFLAEQNDECTKPCPEHGHDAIC
jgi:hypothetical protein